MGDIDCLKACPECRRHVRCGERACPFCGTALTFLMRAPEYRLKTRLGRGATVALGAALGAAGFVMGCDDGTLVPLYGAVCSPPSCGVPSSGGDAGRTGSAGGTAGSDQAGGGGTADSAGGTTGGAGGGAAGSDAGGGGGALSEGGAAGAVDEPSDGGAAGR